MKSICFAIVFFAACLEGNAQDASPTLDDFISDPCSDISGREIIGVRVPGVLPTFYRAPVAIPSDNSVILDSVPAFIWSFGCSPTVSAMAAGYYDLHGYPNVYTGPANNGQIPLDNSNWGMVTINNETRNQCPLSATMLDLDERNERGHIDDYWISTFNYGPDPYITNGWCQHEHGECTGDFMGTSQSAVGNSDGTTRFFFAPDGSPLSDYVGSEPLRRDGCHGLRLFYESRGYCVIENYTQLVRGIYGNTIGYTFEQYKEEIDNGRPVILQLTGHSVLGLGYDEPDIVYLHDTWDFNIHTMGWGGSYAGLTQWGVTVIRLEVTNSAPQTDFIGTPESIVAGQAINFSDFSQYSPTTWQWNFTGGVPSFSSDPNPIIYYNTPGTYSVSLTTANDYGYDSKTRYDYINVNSQQIRKTLHMTLFLEGLFDVSDGLMNAARDEDDINFPTPQCDEIQVILRSSTSSYSIVATMVNIPIYSDGNCSVNIPVEFSGDYYIVIEHRNSLETWSALPVSFDAQDIFYDFSSCIELAYGNMLKLIGDKYCIYSGDINQDGSIDLSDIDLVDNQASVFATGYLPEDVNGDGKIDAVDLIIVDNNVSLGIQKISP